MVERSDHGSPLVGVTATRRRHGRPLLEGRQESLEGGRVGAPEQLVGGHLGRGDDGARAGDAVQPALPVQPGAGGDGVGGDVNGVAGGEGVEGRLQDADVGLAAGHQDGRPAGGHDRLAHGLVAQTGKDVLAQVHVARQALQLGGDIRHGRADALRVVLGDHDGDLQHAGGAEEEAGRAQDAPLLAQEGDELLLQVDDQKEALLGLQPSSPHARLRSSRSSRHGSSPFCAAATAGSPGAGARPAPTGNRPVE